MKLNYWFVWLVMVATLSPSPSGLTRITYHKNLTSSKNQSIKHLISQKIPSRTDTYIFGLRKTVPPISYRDNNEEWRGYCIDFLNSLERDLKEKTDSDKKIEIVAVDRKNRFTGKGDNKEPLDGECGPNTINKERLEKLKKVKGRFSNPFASTGASFLVKTENVKHFYNKEYWKEKSIGVMNSTTTQQVVQQVYPLANIKIVDSDIEAKSKLINNEIFAYISDTILLKGILDDLSRESDIEFSILPNEERISYEEYGMVVYQDNKELLDHINKFLESEQAKKLRRKYLDGDNTIVDSIYLLLYKRKWFISLVVVIFIVGLAGGVISSRVFLILKRKSDGGRLNLCHKQDVNPRAIAISFKQLAENHPDAELRIVEMEVKGEDKFLLRAKTAKDANYSELNTEYFTIYNRLKALAEQDLQALLDEKDSRIRSSENMIMMALQRPSVHANTYQNNGDTMPEAQKSEYNLHGSVGSVANQGYIASSGNENTIGNAAGNVKGDQKTIQHNYVPEQKQTLAKAAAEIQQLLKLLEHTNPTATETQQIEHINDETTPKFKKHIVGALQATGETAIDEFVLENKYLKVVKAAIKGWMKPE